jgi:hypothetical protein
VTQPAFLPGEKVVVRVEFLLSPTTSRATVHELWEPALYEEAQLRRKELCIGTVTQTLVPGAPDGTLVVQDGEGQTGTATFRVTEKTMFRKNGVPVAPSAFPVGSEVVVKPRALPSGMVMAVIVAESEEAVAMHYKDTLGTWDGTVERIDVPNGYLVLARTDGAKRNVLFPRNFTVTDEKARNAKGDKRFYNLAELTGKPIHVRLVRSERPRSDGTRTATEVTVTTPGAATGEPRDSAKGAPASAEPR